LLLININTILNSVSYKVDLSEKFKTVLYLYALTQENTYGYFCIIYNSRLYQCHSFCPTFASEHLRYK